MSILVWIIFGLVAGALAKLLMPGRDPGGFITTIVIGVVGALIGGFLSQALGMGDVDGFNFGSLVIAVLGAIILLIIYRMVMRSRTTV